MGCGFLLGDLTQVDGSLTGSSVVSRVCRVLVWGVGVPGVRAEREQGG